MQHDQNADFQLGDIVTDKISGYHGIVTRVAYHITGCERYGVKRLDEPSAADEETFFYPTQLEQEGHQRSIYDETPITHVEFDLGWKLRDRVTGREGVATTIAFELHNCPDVAITPLFDEQPDEYPGRDWYDAPRVEVIDRPDTDTHLSRLGTWLEGLRGSGEAATGAMGSKNTSRSDAP